MMAALRHSLHGVMIRYQDSGILICGEPGIGKSSLALELIQHGAILIADDVVDFAVEENVLMAHCPDLLSGLLHTRELGLMDIREIFDNNTWKASSRVDLCIELKPINHSEPSLIKSCPATTILDKTLEMLPLSIENPASLKTRIDTWLRMQRTPISHLKNLPICQQNRLAC